MVIYWEMRESIDLLGQELQNKREGDPVERKIL